MTKPAIPPSEPPRPQSQPLPPSVSILVDPDQLQAARDNGLYKVDWLQRFNPFRGHTRVNVEALPDNTKDALFYAPFHISGQSNNATPMQFVQVHPDKVPDIVRQGEEFDISFVGMSVTPHDIGPRSTNELLFYSLVADKTGEVVEAKVEESVDEAAGVDVAEDGPNGKEGAAGNAEVGDVPKSEADNDVASGNTSPTAVPDVEQAVVEPPVVPVNTAVPVNTPVPVKPASQGLPFIHYDPVIDAHQKGDEPDSFVPIPASKSLYMQSHRDDIKNSVYVRFSVMEVDAECESQLRAVSQIGDISAMTNVGGIAVPQLQPLSGALHLASVLGKKGLKEYSKPDHVLSKDVEFKLAAAKSDGEEVNQDETAKDAVGEGGGKSDAFLRYGYYFFLNKKVDARLYAHTGCSSQSVPLLLKRVGFDRKKAWENEAEMFPLTGISYVVMKVSRGCAKDVPNRYRLRKEHQARLDGMLKMNDMVDMLSSIEKRS